MSDVAKRISNLLEEQNITQRRLAELSGVTEVTISRYLNGSRNPRAEILNSIANVLGVSTDYLLGRTADKTSSPNSCISTTNQNDDLQKFMESLDVTFIGASRKDKDAIYKRISQLYWEDKEREDKN